MVMELLTYNFTGPALSLFGSLVKFLFSILSYFFSGNISELLFKLI